MLDKLSMIYTVYKNSACSVNTLRQPIYLGLGPNFLPLRFVCVLLPNQRIQYCSSEYQEIHKKHNIQCSMRDSYDCYQNTLAE